MTDVTATTGPAGVHLLDMNQLRVLEAVLKQHSVDVSMVADSSALSASTVEHVLEQMSLA
jgi:DNA-binding MarR family transcriptional regulator